MFNNNRKGTTRAVDGVVYREGVYDQLGEIDTRTLIIVGDQDTAPAAGGALSALAPGFDRVLYHLRIGCREVRGGEGIGEKTGVELQLFLVLRVKVRCIRHLVQHVRSEKVGLLQVIEDRVVLPVIG